MSLTIVEPLGITAAGNAALIWVPAIANPAAPTVAELSAGLNVSCAIEGWAPSVQQDTVERRRYCDKTTTERLGTAKWSVEPIIYDYSPQAPSDTGDYRAYATLAPGTTGYLVDRRGIPAKDTIAATQIVDIYPVELGAQSRVPVDETEGATLRVSQQVAVIAQPTFDAAITA